MSQQRVWGLVWVAESSCRYEGRRGDEDVPAKLGEEGAQKAEGR